MARLSRLAPTGLAAILLVIASEAWSAFRAETIVVRGGQRISGLSFSKPRYSLVLRELSNGQIKLLVRITGRFEARKSRLLLNGEPVALDSSNFDLELTIRDATTRLEFASVDAFGKTQNETIQLYSDPPDPVRELLKKFQTETSSLSVGVSGSLMNYEDNSGESLRQYGLGAKVSYSQFLSNNRRHVAAGNVYSTFLPLARSRTDTFLRLIGLNLRYGYFLGDFAQWKLWLYGGYFYTTTLSPGGRLGFTNLLGPQLYPTASIQIGRRQSIATYFKFAPLYSPTDLASREIAFGASYSTRPLLGGTKTVSLDYSQITLIAGRAEIRLTSTVLGYSVGF